MAHFNSEMLRASSRSDFDACGPGARPRRTLTLDGGLSDFTSSQAAWQHSMICPRPRSSVAISAYITSRPSSDYRPCWSGMPRQSSSYSPASPRQDGCPLGLTGVCRMRMDVISHTSPLHCLQSRLSRNVLCAMFASRVPCARHCWVQVVTLGLRRSSSI